MDLFKALLRARTFIKILADFLYQSSKLLLKASQLVADFSIPILAIQPNLFSLIFSSILSTYICNSGSVKWSYIKVNICYPL